MEQKRIKLDLKYKNDVAYKHIKVDKKQTNQARAHTHTHTHIRI